MICGQGTAPAAATIAAYRGARPRPDARHRAARRGGAGRVRRLAAAAARLRHHAARATCSRRRSATPRTAIRCVPTISATIERRAAELFRTRVADLGRGLSAGRRACRRRAACSATRRWPPPTRGILAEAEAAGGDREAQIEAARARLVPGLRRRGDRPLLPRRRRCWTPPAGATAACSPATTWPAGRRRVEAPLTYDYHGYTLVQGRALEPGAGGAAAARAARGLRPRRPRPARTRLRPHSSPSAPSSPLPTARPSTATRTSSRCRWRRCCPTPTTTTRRELIERARLARAAARRIAGYGGAIALRPRTWRRRRRARRRGRRPGEPTVDASASSPQRARRRAATPATST